ncbi:MAG: DUF4350 domain-containing protein [Burkholderiaceae bacterium]|nr:DUF4350 domain-containing protein [Burkholderiaceae bacterium]
MSDGVRNSLIGLLVAVILGGIVWFFLSNFGPSWDPVLSTSDEAAKNPMLGAERLLEKRGYKVKVDQTLSLALFQPLPEGTLIMGEGGDDMLVTQSQALLSWVERGNTLILSQGWRRTLFNFTAGKAQPKQKPATDAAAQEAKTSISAQFGVELGPAAARGSICRQHLFEGELPQPKAGAAPKSQLNVVDCVAQLSLPGVAHPLRLDVSESRLIDAGSKTDSSVPAPQHARNNDADPDDDEDEPPPSPKAGDEAPAETDDNAMQSAAIGTVPVMADDEAKAVRIYAHGRGRVVVLAEHYFDNYKLAAYDHGELLLGLAALNAHGKSVTLIQRIDVAAWYSILWHAAPYAICTTAAFLLLWAWSAMRRFGPQLPDPDDRRRALLEHIDASGRWLWKSTKGREIMLAAMRRAAERALARRIPELRKLAPERQVERLAADGKMSRAELERALLDAPGKLPIEFTRQIQTLQELKAHYER